MDLTSSSVPNQPPPFNSDPRYPHGSHHPHPQHQHQPQQYTPYSQQQYDYSAYAQHQQPPLPPPAAYHHHHGAGLPDGAANGHQAYTSPPPPQVAPSYHHHQFMPASSAGFHQPTLIPPQHPSHYPPSSAPTNSDHQDGNFYASHVSPTNGAPPIQSAYLEPSPVTQIPPNDVYTNGHTHHQHPLQPYTNGMHPPSGEPPLLPGHPPPYTQAPEPHFASGMMPAPEPFPGGGAMVGETASTLDYAQMISTWQHLASMLQPHSRPSPTPASTQDMVAALPSSFPHQLFKVAMEGLRSMEPSTAERIAKDSPLAAPPKQERDVRQPESGQPEADDGEGGGDKDDNRKKPKGDDKNGADPQQCLTCGARSSPEWRRGPLGPRTLCNACGLVYIKIMKRRANGLPEEDSAAGEDDPQESGYTSGGSR